MGGAYGEQVSPQPRQPWDCCRSTCGIAHTVLFSLSNWNQYYKFETGFVLSARCATSANSRVPMPGLTLNDYQVRRGNELFLKYPYFCNTKVNDLPRG